MKLSYDRAGLEQALARFRSRDGIAEIRAWINEGDLNVGDDIMVVVVAGRFPQGHRPRVSGTHLADQDGNRPRRRAGLKTSFAVAASRRVVAMKNVLILFAHPRFENSITNRALVAGLETVAGVTLHDLYEAYPDFNIDVEREQALLAATTSWSGIFPFTCTARRRSSMQWIDTVLEYGWAHGSKGNALSGKTALVALTAGGSRDVYTPAGHNRHSLGEFLTPFKQTALLCKMRYLPPFAVHGSYLLKEDERSAYVAAYRRLLGLLDPGRSKFSGAEAYGYLNELVAARQDDV
jgi:glutathione-regulated potassium-efflux system ancillary protein KefG